MRASISQRGASVSDPGYPPGVRVLAGTSGFSYPAWKGSFYPADLPGGRMLSYYAGRFATVEVNNTFYRVPSAKTLAGWRAEVPEGFRFALKAPQRITHQKRLSGCADTVGFFYQAAAELGDELGAVLYQLPPNLKKDLPRLAAFLDLLPPGGRAAFEFRNATWFADDVYEALRARNAALCVAESEDLEVPLVATASWGYLRLRRADYGGAELEAWAERIRDQPWTEAFAFFKHEEEGKGPRLAAALLALIEARP
jgi:uncharacterized protein YecE (DUF72 family)